MNQASPQRAVAGFALSLIGAVLILLRGIVRIIVGHDILNFAGSDFVRHRFFAGAAISLLGVAAVAFAVIIMVGAYFMYSGMTEVGGTIVVIFSVLSLFVGSGWLLGLIFGLIGGILGLLKK